MSKIENTKMLETFVIERKRGSRPVPLKETSYDIEVVSGVAVVKQTRRFRNDEKRPIEAVLTFPVAFNAVVTSLECTVGGRVLKGQAQVKQKARETYESAIDNGKTAVLHEELLPGLHMVSVANVAPDAEIVVVATYLQPLALSKGAGSFRVPLTIGEIFGQLPLQDSDQVKLGGENGEVKVSIRTSSGRVYVNDELPKDGSVTVKLNDVIEVRVEELVVESLGGIAADGRPVKVDFAIPSDGDCDLDIDVMIDTSGSMGLGVSGRMDMGRSKYDAVMEALRRSFSQMRQADKVGVWEFNSRCDHVGRASGTSAGGLLAGVGTPRMGTNLAEAVSKVVASRVEPQILLITDGQAGRMIDVQEAVSRGARVTVVLVGQDSLEVNAGYLASQSGGEMFVVASGDAGRAVEAAVASMRSAASPVRPVEGDPTAVTRRLAGTEITATWGQQAERTVDGIAALAAHLVMTSLDEKRASALAAAEGIVSHLTSIVLVDEEGATLTDLPEQRQVALPTSSVATRGMMFAAAAPSGAMTASLSASGSSRGGMGLLGSGGGLRSMRVGSKPEALMIAPSGVDDASVFMELADDASVGTVGFKLPDLLIGDGSYDLTGKGYLNGIEAIFRGLDWNSHVSELTSTPLGILPASVAAAIIRIGSLDAFIKASDAAKVPSTSLAAGILAALYGGEDRSAQRIARKLLAKLPGVVVESLKAAVKSGQ